MLRGRFDLIHRSGLFPRVSFYVSTFMKITDYPNRIPEIYGTFIFIGLLVYFFLMLALGLINVVELRLLNLPIMGTGIYLAIKQFRRTHDGQLDYFRALVLGVSTGFIGTSSFVLFLFIYMKLQTNFLTSILEGEALSEYMNTYIATFAVWIEGIFSGFIMTFILINYMKTDKVS